MDFGVAQKFGGVCNLRFDDTNPQKEDTEYVEAIKQDIEWLGFKWGNIYHASDYFQKLWNFAIRLIKEGKAYVDEQTSEEIAAQKGTPTQPGVESPYRNRPIEESLQLFERMNSGEIAEEPWYFVPKSIWQILICTSAILSFIESSIKSIIALVISGRFTPCTTLHMVRVITLRA